jgi:hypothetical protein
VTRNHFAAAVALVVIAASGCGEKQADYRSVWTTTTTTTTAGPDENPVPISEYLESVGVTGEPVAPEKMTDFTVTMPQPPGWTPYEGRNLAPGTRLIAKGSTYPTAMLMVFKLHGEFDIAKALQHGDADAERSLNFRRLNASDANFRGFPSSMIEGSYDLNERRMHTYNRIVIPTGPPPANQRYLIQFTVTGYAERAVEEAPDIEAIIRGFNVVRK